MSELAPPRTASAALILATLFIGAFVTGSSETMPVGLLTSIAHATHTAIGTTGALVSAYALSFAIGGTLLSFATASWSRRRVLLAALAAAFAGNCVMALSESFPLLIIARIVGGTAQGWFVGAAIAVAIGVVSADRIGRAISVVVTGFAASTALGVPSGVGIASLLGWHSAFAIVAALVALTWIGVFLFVTAGRSETIANTSEQIRHALAPKVLFIVAIAIVLFAGQYAGLTYVSPYLQQSSGVSEGAIGWYLLGFGLASAVGSTIGGRLADNDSRGTLAIANAAVALAMVIFVSLSSLLVGSFLALLVWGLISVSFVPSIQALVSNAAGPGRDIAAVLPAAGINLGIAGGSLAGGVAVNAYGSSAAMATGIIICALTTPATLLLWRSR